MLINLCQSWPEAVNTQDKVVAPKLEAVYDCFVDIMWGIILIKIERQSMGQ